MELAIPSISVVIPAYNAVSSVGRAITSVLEQSIRPHEIIVIDDGSSDGTAEVVKNFGDSVRYIHRENGGSSSARNCGIRVATGEWIAFLDADDVWKAEKTRRQLELLNRHVDLAWMAAGYTNVQDGVEVSKCKTPHAELFVQDGVATDALQILGARWSIWTGTVMVRKQVFDCVGDFDEAQRTSHDLDLWIRIAVKYPKLGWVIESIADYEVNNPSGLTTTSISIGDATLLMLYQRAVQQAASLPVSRRKYVMEFTSWHGAILLRELVRVGRQEQARWLLSEFKQMGVRVPKWLDFGTRFAPMAIIRQYRWVLRLRARLGN